MRIFSDRRTQTLTYLNLMLNSFHLKLE